MAQSWTVPENFIIAGSLDPATDAAGRTGSYVDLKRGQRAYAIWYITQGNAATIVCSLSKVTTIAGAVGATAGTATHRIWATNDASSSVLTAQTAGTSFTTSAALKDKIVVMEVDPGSEGATFIAVAPVTGASNAANLTSAFVLVVPKIDAATTANALVD